MLVPYPRPYNLPEPIAMNPCVNCHDVSSMSEDGLRKVFIRSCKYVCVDKSAVDPIIAITSKINISRARIPETKYIIVPAQTITIKVSVSGCGRSNMPAIAQIIPKGIIPSFFKLIFVLAQLYHAAIYKIEVSFNNSDG